MAKLLRFFAIIGFFTSPIYAQVIEVGPDGEATVYDVPTIFGDENTLPVVEQAAYSSHSNIKGSFATASVAQVEQDYGLPKGLVHAVIHQESRGRVDAVSIKGALGLMQLMPGTAAQLGVNPNDPEQNVRGGALYLRQQMDRFGSIPLALAAYNAGPGAVLRYGGIPPYRETQNYVSTIMRRWQPPQSSRTTAASRIVAPIVPAINENAFFIEVTEP